MYVFNTSFNVYFDENEVSFAYTVSSSVIQYAMEYIFRII